MPTLPTPHKTWSYDHTTVTGGSGAATCANILLHIKNKMVSMGGWVVKGSSNASAAGMDNVDRWSTTGNMTWANPGVAHSWIVLESAALGVQLLIDLQADGLQRTIWPSYSPGKLFSGGSTTTAPTSTTDGCALYDGSGCLFAEGGNVTTSDVHTMASSDNECFRVAVLTTTGALGPCGGWILDKIQGADPAQTCPVAICINGTNQNFNSATLPFRRDLLSDGDGGYIRGPSSLQPTVSCLQVLGGMGRQQGATSYLFVHEYNGASEVASAPGWLIEPVSVWGTSPGNTGRLGYLADFWLASATPTTCDSYPADNSKSFMQFGHVVFYWDGTTMSTAYTRTARDGYAAAAGVSADRSTLLFEPKLTEPITFSQLGPPGLPPGGNREI